MLSAVLASVSAKGSEFVRPDVDFHALAPELVLTGAIVLVLLADLVTPKGARGIVPQIAGIGLLASMVPVLTLAVDGADRGMFGGAYAVDNFSLVLKALFLLAGYVVVLLSTNYVAEGDYAEGEYYFLLLSSVLGMTVMASSRDLVSIFVALELLSIPAYLLAGWRKRDLHGNEAGAKYYLMGVFASAVMLYGMSLLYGFSGSTLLSDIGATIGAGDTRPLVTLGIILVVVGFAFKVSAVPFHTWAPDTYEGAPTPITAFLAVSSKAAGFVALLQLILVAFPGRSDVIEPLMWFLAALTMTVGNLIALRQTNIVRMLAYSGVAQAGFMLAPLAVVGSNPDGALRRHRDLPADLRRDEPRGVRGRAGRRPQDAQRRDHELGWPVRVRARPDRPDDGVPLQPGRHPAARRLARQVRRVPRSRAARPDRGRGDARRRGRRELGDRPLLLRATSRGRCG